MPPLPDNNAKNDPSEKKDKDKGGAPSAPTVSSPAPKTEEPEGVEITLEEEFIHHGKIYGPGTMRIRDDGAFKAADVAKDLNESQARVKKSRRPGEAVLLPNRTITGIQPGTELDSHISNALSPEDVAKLREDAERQAQENLVNDRGGNQKRAAAVPAVGTRIAPAAKGGGGKAGGEGGGSGGGGDK